MKFKEGLFHTFKKPLDAANFIIKKVLNLRIRNISRYTTIHRLYSTNWWQQITYKNIYTFVSHLINQPPVLFYHTYFKIAMNKSHNFNVYIIKEQFWRNCLLETYSVIAWNMSYTDITYDNLRREQTFCIHIY